MRISSPSRRRRGAAAALVLASLAAVCAGCSSSAGSDGSASTGRSTTTTAPAPEAYEGTTEGFYEVPDPLPKGAPGQLIRVQDLGEKGDVQTVRVMYHSRDAAGADRAVTGLISYPTTPAPKDGWPVTSLANGTVGLAPQCALSRNGATPGDWGVEGVHAVTDYIGLGPVGEIHPYLSGPSEGDSVIDAVRAARNLPDAHAGARWFSIGHSQGGHGALFAGERAASYAPELDLLGTVSMAPATELTKTYGPADEVVSRIVGVMMLYGASSEHPDIHFDDYAGTALQAASKVFETGCLDQIIPAMAAIPADEFYAHDPLKTEPAKSDLQQNQPGLVATPSPLFLAQGTSDERVNVQRTKDFFARVCKLGQVTDLLIVPGADHGGIVPAAAPKAAAWMNDRLAGKAPPDSCP
ncbi:lipase family protein [Aquihabitans sp. McL0605]|uniref:lipase family protein n=1 Tax=Aquihabitans sp. McL0605 TaxID=3415671 RepID=UPI003CF15740